MTNDPPRRQDGPHALTRRDVLVGLASIPLIGCGAEAGRARLSGAPIAPTTASAVRAYGVGSAAGGFGPLQIHRRAAGPEDVLLDVLYCGICHSDIHTARSEWGPVVYPCVPGHEIIGRVRAVGSAVTKFTAGDIGGVGCMVDSCGHCVNCLANREQNCLDGATFSYDSPDRVSGGTTYGGYTEAIVVSSRFVVRIPKSADLAATAPLLCAGVTTFSPMQHWNLRAGQRVGVVGLGGLGHVAVKLAAARNADVTVFTTSPGKVEDARRLGAIEAVLSTDAAAMKRLANQFQLLISTVPQGYPMQPFMDLLALDGTLVNVGALGALEGVNGRSLAFGRKSLAGSLIGGIAETQEVIDYCTARNIKADIELIRPDRIDAAYTRVVNKDVRYRFVIDMAGSRHV